MVLRQGVGDLAYRVFGSFRAQLDQKGALGTDATQGGGSLPLTTWISILIEDEALEFRENIGWARILFPGER